MPRPQKAVPEYKYHVSGQARVYIQGKYYYLGPHNSPESQAKYRRLVGEYIATGKAPSDEVHQADMPITVADVTAEARVWIAIKFATNQTQHRRYNNLCTTLDDEYGNTPADEFGPRKLSELRDLFVASGNCRKYANTQTRSVIRIFRYALSRELIDPMVIVRLESLESLRFGQTTARESTPVTPANLEHVRATAKVLSPTLKAMIRIQAATGMRPSELCRMRPCDIDMANDDAWMYRPAEHKTARLGKSKAVPIIGDARAAIIPFLSRDPEAFCFRPAESMEWYRQERARQRTTPPGYGNGRGRKRDRGGLKGGEGKRLPGRHYNKDSYRIAIKNAAKKAGVPHWFPYQLRHLAGTIVRDLLGVEAAQALLGHSHVDMTEVYAKLSEAKAIEAAKVAPKL